MVDDASVRVRTQLDGLHVRFERQDVDRASDSGRSPRARPVVRRVGRGCASTSGVRSVRGRCVFRRRAFWRRWPGESVSVASESVSRGCGRRAGRERRRGCARGERGGVCERRVVDFAGGVFGSGVSVLAGATLDVFSGGAATASVGSATLDSVGGGVGLHLGRGLSGLRRACDGVGVTDVLEVSSGDVVLRAGEQCFGVLRASRCRCRRRTVDVSVGELRSRRFAGESCEPRERACVRGGVGVAARVDGCRGHAGAAAWLGGCRDGGRGVGGDRAAAVYGGRRVGYGVCSEGRGADVGSRRRCRLRLASDVELASGGDVVGPRRRGGGRCGRRGAAVCWRARVGV